MATANFEIGNKEVVQAVVDNPNFRSILDEIYKD